MRNAAALNRTRQIQEQLVHLVGTERVVRLQDVLTVRRPSEEDVVLAVDACRSANLERADAAGGRRPASVLHLAQAVGAELCDADLRVPVRDVHLVASSSMRTPAS